MSDWAYEKIKTRNVRLCEFISNALDVGLWFVTTGAQMIKANHYRFYALDVGLWFVTPQWRWQHPDHEGFYALDVGLWFVTLLSAKPHGHRGFYALDVGLWFVTDARARLL